MERNFNRRLLKFELSFVFEVSSKKYLLENKIDSTKNKREEIMSTESEEVILSSDKSTGTNNSSDYSPPKKKSRLETKEISEGNEIIEMA